MIYLSPTVELHKTDVLDSHKTVAGAELMTKSCLKHTPLFTYIQEDNNMMNILISYPIDRTVLCNSVSVILLCIERERPM